MSRRDSGEKTFVKYYLKRNPETGDVVIKDGEPILAEKIRDTRITQRHADILNADWDQSGLLWVEFNEEEAKAAKAKAAEEEAAKAKAIEEEAKAEAIIAAKELKFDATNIDEVKAKIKALVDAGLIEKPYPATGIDKLNLSINEVK